MRQADGSRVDAVRNLDKGSVGLHIPGRNPGRSFIGCASGDGFATAPDLVRFAHALHDGTLLDRPYADLFAGAKLPGPEPTAFEAYTMPVSIINAAAVISHQVAHIDAAGGPPGARPRRRGLLRPGHRPMQRRGSALLCRRVPEWAGASGHGPGHQGR